MPFTILNDSLKLFVLKYAIRYNKQGTAQHIAILIMNINNPDEGNNEHIKYVIAPIMTVIIA